MKKYATGFGSIKGWATKSFDFTQNITVEHVDGAGGEIPKYYSEGELRSVTIYQLIVPFCEGQILRHNGRRHKVMSVRLEPRLANTRMQMTVDTLDIGKDYSRKGKR